VVEAGGAARKLTGENLFTTCEDDYTDVVIVLCLI
jgi:hypothetical protein